MMQCHFAMFSSNYTIYLLWKKISYNINHIIMDEDIFEFECQEYEKPL